MIIARKRFIERLDQAMANAEKMAPEDLLWSYKGVLYPATHCSMETFQALESFEARSDDVLLVGYPKTDSDPDTTIIYICLFGGKIGDWKNLFTEAQDQEMDKKFEEQLAGTKLGAKIKYEVYCKT